MRRVAIAVTCAVVLAAAGSGMGATGIHFLGVPTQVFRGERVTFHIYGATTKTCSLAIHYTGGRVQKFAPKKPSAGVITWTFRVPSVKPGPATLRVTCGKSSAIARFPVQAALETPKLVVTRSGFSQQSYPYSTNSAVNFGIAVRNERLHTDATNASIVVNAVDATNRVLGTAHVTAALLPEAETIFLGGQIGLPTQTPVVRLETIFVSATPAAHIPSTPLLVSDAVIQPDSQNNVLNVHGQLLNKYPRPMQSSIVGVLIQDASGKVVGGGTGFAVGPLSLGAREAFELDGPFSAIKWSSGLTAVFTTVPTYATS
jgi:hypothetical protein